VNVECIILSILSTIGVKAKFEAHPFVSSCTVNYTICVTLSFFSELWRVCAAALFLFFFSFFFYARSGNHVDVPRN
jgi:hypothetical protein